MDTPAIISGQSLNNKELKMKTYVILGGGGSFGIHAAKYLLDHANPKRVIGIGRNPLRPEPFSLNIDKIPGYEYYAYHLTYEMDLLLDLQSLIVTLRKCFWRNSLYMQMRTK